MLREKGVRKSGTKHECCVHIPSETPFKDKTVTKLHAPRCCQMDLGRVGTKHILYVNKYVKQLYFLNHQQHKF